MQIADKYSPQEIESKWYDYWIEKRLFHSEPDQREPYTIVIPPPNVTGMLHMGHSHQRHYYKHYGGIYYPLVRPVGVYLRYGELSVQHLLYFFYVEFFLFIHIAPPVSSASCAGIR